jgi:hypothetical protein
MPTNKLWIEHTERAAWESVSALRTELAEEKKRIERLAPPVEGWQALFEAIDVLQQQHSLGGKTYADVVRGIVDRLALLEARLRAAQEDLARAHVPPAPAATSSSTQVRSATPSEAPLSDEPSDFLLVARRFVRAMQRRYGAMEQDQAAVGMDELLGSLAAKVDELADMDEIELADAAVDVAVLALCLHKEARGPT